MVATVVKTENFENFKHAFVISDLGTYVAA